MDFLPNVIALNALFPSDLEVRTFAPLQRSPEALPLVDLTVVNSFVRLLRARLLVEFGTARGRTAINMALNAADDAEVISIDIQRHLPEYVHSGTRITRIVAASRSFDETPYAGRVDFVFIDGAHEYEDVLSDSRKALTMVKPGGVVLWHDYHPTQPGVTRALHELYESEACCEGLTRILLEDVALSSMVYYQAPKPADRLASVQSSATAGDAHVNRARTPRQMNVGQDEEVPHPEFRVYSVVELFPDETLVQVFSPFARSHEATTYFDVAILNSLANLLKPRLIVEFGTATGRTALNLAINAPDASVITIDIAPNPKQYVLEPFSERVTRVITPSAEFDGEPWAHQADLVFIDGDHDYETVLADSLKAIELVRPGGVLIWHDYHASQPGVTRALHELYATDVRFRNLAVICPYTTFALLFAS